MFCALFAWGDVLQPSVVVYTDNNGVRDSLIACHTSNRVARDILVATLALEMKLCLRPWYARVPTDSKISDAPSRLDTKFLTDLKVAQNAVDIDRLVQHVTDMGRNWGDVQAVTLSPQLENG